MKRFFIALIFAIGALSSLVTLVWAFFSAKIVPVVELCPWLYLGIMLLIAVVYATLTVRKRERVTIYISPTVKANIYFGDIFDVEGVAVIPFNDYFDTIVNDAIVSSKTLHGQFIKKYFDGKEFQLVEQIKKTLRKISPSEQNTTRSQGNKNKYPLGTACEVNADEKVFFLFALTKFNDNERAEVNSLEYQQVLNSILYFLDQKSNGRKISIPLIGSGHSGIKLKPQKILEYILFIITLQDQLTLIKGIDIVLHKSVKDEIDLAAIENSFEYIRS